MIRYRENIIAAIQMHVFPTRNLVLMSNIMTAGYAAIHANEQM